MRPKEEWVFPGREETAEAVFRLEPDKRLTPSFGPSGTALFPVASPEQMGVRVVDDCCQEHEM